MLLLGCNRCISSMIVEQQVGQLVRSVAAVAEQPGEVDVGEVGVGAALRRGHADLGRGRVVVELDEEALQQFARRLPRQRAVGESLLVEGPEMLVKVPRAEGIPAVEFGDDGEVSEPVGLQRLVEVARRVRGHPPADLGDPAEFPLAVCVGGASRLRVSQFGVALREADHRVAGKRHRPQLFALVERLRVPCEVQRRLGIGDVGLEVEHPLAVQLAVGHGMARGSLLHELGDSSRRRKHRSHSWGSAANI